MYVSARRNHSCWDSVTVQHARLLFLFSLSRSSSSRRCHPSIANVRGDCWGGRSARILPRLRHQRVSSSCDLRDSQATTIVAFALTSEPKEGIYMQWRREYDEREREDTHPEITSRPGTGVAPSIGRISTARSRSKYTKCSKMKGKGEEREKERLTDGQI